MLFVVSPQGIKNNINIWYAIYPLALPNININQGWEPAAGSFPKFDGKEMSIPHDSESVPEAMIAEIKNNIFPFFTECSSLKKLERLYSEGNFRAKYPQAFTLLAMNEYENGQRMLHNLTDAFEKEPWGFLEKKAVNEYVKMQTFEEIEGALQSTRVNNIKKYKLVKYMKDAN